MTYTGPSDNFDALLESWGKLRVLFNAFQTACLIHCPACANSVERWLTLGVVSPALCPAAGDTFEVEGRREAAYLLVIITRVQHRGHGTHVVVEAHRPPRTGFTEWHYFNVVNIRGTVYVFDAYTYFMSANSAQIRSYMARNHFNRYSIVHGFSPRLVAGN
jgi:hypothetical protein